MDTDSDYISDEFEVSDIEDDEHELFEDDEVDNEIFVTADSEKQKEKAYEVAFKVHSIQDITNFQTKEINHVSGILGIQEQHAATLLRYFNWNKEKLIESFMDNPEKVQNAAGVITDSKLAPKFQVINGFMCDICCDDSPDLQTLALSCGHRYCRNCYDHYLIQKIKEEGESRRIQCMCPDCNLVVDGKTIEMVVSADVYQRYRSLLIRTYVDDNPFYRWCPAPNCEYAVECHVPPTQLTKKVPSVSCACSHKFCFGCGANDHQPTICFLLKLWMKKCRDDSETANWISANTKECPKCQSTIEKNGGCNHMTCKKCKYEFCWVCMGPWSEHGSNWYNCNRYEEKSSHDARDAQAKSRQALERYLHYYNRYANHEQSARLDQELYHRTEKKMEEMQQTSDLSWIEVQFLKKAVDILVQCRMTLKYTYAFAYYLTRNNQTELFEDNQRDLEMAVEQLSELLEKPIEKEKIAELRQQVLDKMVYVSTRREIVLEDTAKGLADGRWSWNVEVK
ncbi:hypothetical protein BKA69DRAFT_1024375 [Paraphysoderma sedebokerense]|nr:hypothetical protein BKA69DRAFT_1024375 [Paraphysoderma sedebokerense]